MPKLPAPEPDEFDLRIYPMRGLEWPTPRTKHWYRAMYQGTLRKSKTYFDFRLKIIGFNLWKDALWGKDIDTFRLVPLPSADVFTCPLVNRPAPIELPSTDTEIELSDTDTDIECL